MQLREIKIDLVNKDIGIIKFEIIGLHFIKWKMRIAHRKTTFPS